MSSSNSRQSYNLRLADDSIETLESLAYLSKERRPASIARKLLKRSVDQFEPETFRKPDLHHPRIEFYLRVDGEISERLEQWARVMNLKTGTLAGMLLESDLQIARDSISEIGIVIAVRDSIRDRNNLLDSISQPR
jgi:hypothetical protein